jgi:hypothetical protein
MKFYIKLGFLTLMKGKGSIIAGLALSLFLATAK